MRSNIVNVRANANDEELDITSSLSGIRYSASEVGRFVRLGLLLLMVGGASILAADWTRQQGYGLTIDALAIGSILFGLALKGIGAYWLIAPIYRECRWHMRPPAETLASVADGVDLVGIRKEIEERVNKEYEAAYRRGQFQKFSRNGHMLTDAIAAHVVALHVQHLANPERRFSSSVLERQDLYGFALLLLDAAQRERLWAAMVRADIVTEDGRWNVDSEKDAIVRVLKAFG